MIEIRLHGRGGQGVVTGAELIAIGAFKNGYEAQAFPAFGVERTGAPIEAYARIDKNPIRTREQVYAPDVLIIQDATLIGTVDLHRGCNDNTIAIVNSSADAETIKQQLGLKRVHVVDATKIALEIFGKNLANTVILGTLAKEIPEISLESLIAAIKEKFADKDKSIIDKNIKAITDAFNS